ncbi:hypothetical protein GCM10011297_17520 [Bacterioplanes sanyensis]|uniref:cold shock domain-containing protein n=1 Tax=Bacterioplanes sanyensis TaxID=1249553 RepID=UPI001982E4B2|nr:cold shock domain-containing protein [Bacterioplanes sanyensis]GGY45011.1 hypothetical protein GCM10011297_17520 [Bacterioplanes sanyensis]
MGKLLVRKLMVAGVSALLSGVVAVLAITSLLSELTLTDGSALTLANFWSLPQAVVLVVIFALLGFAVSFASAQLVPTRRRRHRGSGTVVEEDVDDGRERGVVKWFNVKKGFGFITWDEGEDVFVHFRSIRGQGHRSLTEGQRVKFAVVRGQKGPQAEDVSAIR